MVNKRILGGLAAAALTASSLGVAAGPALAAGPFFSHLTAQFVTSRHDGDLAVNFTESGLRNRAIAPVQASAHVNLTYRFTDRDGHVVTKTVSEDAESAVLVQRARYHHVSGRLYLEAPYGHNDYRGPGAFDAPLPPWVEQHPGREQLIRISWQGVTVDDLKRGVTRTSPFRYTMFVNIGQPPPPPPPPPT